MNTCSVCKMTIDEQWTSLQDSLKQYANKSILNRGLTERCIYCYKALVELVEKTEHEWYLEVLKAREKGSK